MRNIAAIITLALFLMPAPTHACGYTPWSEDADDAGDALRILMSADSLPLLSPGWHAEYWVIAWARLAGKTFSDDEMDALGQQNWMVPGSDLRPALSEWEGERRQLSAQGVDIRPRRRLPNYRYELVCGPDAFRTASETLRARQGTQSAGEVMRWLEAQDRVFQACSSTDAPPPPSPPNDAGTIERNDRAYQRAVWAEYTQQPNAIAAYDEIASTSSEWADLARYRSARLQLARSLSPDIAAAARITTGPKALRALRQLSDRAELFGRSPAQVVSVLSARLLAEDLGADLPRTLRDIVHFSKRSAQACASPLTSLVACETPPSDHLLGRMRRSLAPTWPATTPRLLRLNQAFHAGRAALEAGQGRRARRHARRMRQLARTSTLATRNAAEALALAAGDGAGLTHLFRHSSNGPSIHADGRAWLASGTIGEWQRLARQYPDLNGWVVEHALIRSTLLGTMGRARRFARRLSGDSAFAQAIREALEEPPSEHRGLFLLAIARHEPTELSITQPFHSHYGATQVAGCELGACGDAHPHQTAYAPRRQRRPSAERRRLGLRRIDDLGEAVMSHVRHHPDSSINEQLLHSFVQLTRRASVHHRTSPRTGELSHEAFDYLHANFEDGVFTRQTRYWFR